MVSDRRVAVHRRWIRGTRFWSATGPWIAVDSGGDHVIAVPAHADAGDREMAARAVFDRFDLDGCVRSRAAAVRRGWPTTRPAPRSRRIVVPGVKHGRRRKDPGM